MAIFPVAPDRATTAPVGSSPVLTTVGPAYAVAPASAAIAPVGAAPLVTTVGPVYGVAPASNTIAPFGSSFVLTTVLPIFPASAITAPVSSATMLTTIGPAYGTTPAGAMLGAVVSSPIINAAVVTLGEAKQWLRVDFPDDDMLILAMIDAAVEGIEELSGIVCLPRSHNFKFTAFANRMPLFRNPINSIDMVSYVDGNGLPVSMTPDQYRLGERHGTALLMPAHNTVWPQTGYWPGTSGGWPISGYWPRNGYWPRDTYSAFGGDMDNQIIVAASIGYATPNLVPATIRSLILVCLAGWYDARDIGPIPASATERLAALAVLVV